MPALTLPGVTYHGGHPGKTKETDSLTVVFSRTGIALRRRIRGFLTLRWTDLRGLDVREPDRSLATVIAVGVRAATSNGSLLYLHLDNDVCCMAVDAIRTPQLRATLASWVVGMAGPPQPLPAMPPPEPRELTGPLDVVHAALDRWRAASLGRQPVGNRTDLAYRLDVAEDHRLCGRFAEAVGVLEPLAAEAAGAFGPTHEDTLKVRNALGQAYLSAGDVDDGLEVLREVVVVAEHLLGTDGDLTLVFRNNLAGAYQQAGQYAPAIELHERNVRYSEQSLGRDDVQTVGRRNNLAATLALAGYRERAIGLYWDVLDAMHSLDRNHSLAVNARQNLAILHNPSWRP